MATTQVMETRQESGRLIAFSDGVVAIAITLLILPLAAIELPDGNSEASNRPLEYIWQQNSSLIVSFLVSWFVILVFWLAHHRMFGTIDQVNSGIIRWNVLWLFGIIVLPFPMNLLNQVADSGSGSQQATTFYIGTMFFISLMLSLMSWEIRKDPELLKESLRADPPMYSIRTYVVTIYLFLLLPIAWFFPSVALWGLIGVAVLRAITGPIDELRAADRETRAQTADREPPTFGPPTGERPDGEQPSDGSSPKG